MSIDTDLADELSDVVLHVQNRLKGNFGGQDNTVEVVTGVVQAYAIVKASYVAKGWVKQPQARSAWD
jgi:hypothetical protein